MKTYFIDLFRLPAAVRRFIATESLLGVGIGIFALILNLHLLDRGVQERDIGAINAVAALITGIASIPAGFAMRRIGRKRALVAGLLLMAAGYAAYGVADELPAFYAAQCVVSVGVTLLITSEIQLLFRYCKEKKDEPRAYGALFASFTLFTGAGTLLAGWLPNVLPRGESQYSGALFVAAISLCIAGLARAVLLPAEPAEMSSKPNGSDNEERAETVPPKRDYRNVAVLAVFLFLSGILFGFVVPVLNVIVKLRFNLTDEPLSAIFAVYGFALFLGSLLMPYVLERWGIGRAFGKLYAAELCLLVLLAAPLPVGAFIIPFVLRGGTYTMLNNLAESQTMSAVRDDLRNIFAGVRSVARNLGVSLASLITGYVLTAKHYGWPFLLAAAAILLHALYFYAAAKPLIEKKSEMNKL
ncbi:MFS transporter [Paenibacillus alkalitolerans]|uniref:MFS transporter n=1 Tax=Paenibacillus alkalitolerans TaxID=2799335 RepID=UPI0018F6B901|nr:MFS transporter [Paenibacillus alkalitolerans]